MTAADNICGNANFHLLAEVVSQRVISDCLDLLAKRGQDTAQDLLGSVPDIVK